MNCEVCQKKRINADGTDGGLDCPGVCDTCRRHARIGRAVEGMPEWWNLEQGGDLGWQVVRQPDSNEFFQVMGKGPTPLAALEAAGLVKEDDHG